MHMSLGMQLLHGPRRSQQSVPLSISFVEGKVLQIAWCPKGVMEGWRTLRVGGKSDLREGLTRVMHAGTGEDQLE